MKRLTFGNRGQKMRSLKIVLLLMCLMGAGFGAQRLMRTQGSSRLTSLGTPLVLPLKGNVEQRVLLNDPVMSKNWGLIGTGDSSIQADKAWAITQGTREIVVAVIDTGIDVNHPDIKNNLWKNPGETGFDKTGKDRASNGVDDDGNGLIDDVHGWNFVSNNKDLADNHGHGTHIAGIIGAEGGNGIGISGVSPRVSLMILKYYDPKTDGTDNLKNTIRAIRYAIEKKAKIINYSGGGMEFSEEEKQVVQEAQRAGSLFVAAAGNEYSNSDKAHYYPANYNLDNIVSVTAMNPGAEVLKSSNFGVRTVHLAAPGENIFSTLPGGRYGVMTGTSQATAFASGVAALILANNPNFTYQDIKRQILSTGDEIPGMKLKTETSKKLNSWRALAMQGASVMITGTVSEPASRKVFAAPTSTRNRLPSTANAPAPRIAEQLSDISSLMEAVKRSAAGSKN